MTYLTYMEYSAIPVGADVQEDEFSALEFHAEKLIDSLTAYRIDYASMTEANIRRVKEAMAVQIAYMKQNGGIESMLDDGSLKSEKIGNHSYELSGGIADSSKMIHPNVKSILFPTGLLYRGGRCRAKP